MDKDFNVVARVEALIAGWGHDEAIKRADAYRKAGADAILIHSKINNVSEIEKFLKVIICIYLFIYKLINFDIFYILYILNYRNGIEDLQLLLFQLCIVKLQLICSENGELN